MDSKHCKTKQKPLNFQQNAFINEMFTISHNQVVKIISQNILTESKTSQMFIDSSLKKTENYFFMKTQV